jgi:hypothetical protein
VRMRQGLVGVAISRSECHASEYILLGNGVSRAGVNVTSKVHPSQTVCLQAELLTTATSRRRVVWHMVFP